MWLLWILSLVASFPLPTTGEVVDSFDTCSQFFLGGNPPNLEPNDSARICQRYKNKYRFATMYDRPRRIPMFSAYKYKLGSGKRRENWKIEPQLVKSTAPASMQLEKWYKGNRTLLEESQAVSHDYKSENPATYNRGHLAPVSHQLDNDTRAATFTLTNIVPQYKKLNEGNWEFYEKVVQRFATQCLETYIIVGAVPGNTQLNNRVNIPSHMWAAVCCLLSDQTKKSWAVIAENDKDKIKKLSLPKLEGKLQSHYGQTVDLFNGACY